MNLSTISSEAPANGHSYVFLGTGHERNERRTWIVIILCGVMMLIEIVGGLLFGWLWMDSVAGLVGAVVIASWSYGLIRDTGAILLDTAPDRRLATRIRDTVESNGGVGSDLYLWRLGPGHLGAILSISTKAGHDAAFYRARLGGMSSVSHLTVEMLAVGP